MYPSRTRACLRFCKTSYESSWELVHSCGSMSVATDRTALPLPGNSGLRFGVRRMESEAHVSLTIRHSFARAVSALALAGLVGGLAEQGRAREVIALEGQRSTVSLQAAVDVRRSATGRIAFSAGPHPHEDVYIVNTDGSGLSRLTDDPAADFDPSWSPDGRRSRTGTRAGAATRPPRST